MLTRKFICEEHKDFGTKGWRPLWINGADPLGGMGTAHDTLEHFPSDKGGAEGELMALGAAYFIRGETGILGGRYSAEENLASEFPDILYRIAFEGQTLNEPPTAKRLTEDVEASLSTIVTYGLGLTKDVDSEGYRAILANLPSTYRVRLIGWLRRGYRLAVKRYGRDNQYGVAGIFVNIQREADKLLAYAEEGYELKVSVNLRSNRVLVSLVEPTYEY